MHGSWARLAETVTVVDVEVWSINHEQLLRLQSPLECSGGEVRWNDLVIAGHDHQEGRW